MTRLVAAIFLSFALCSSVAICQKKEKNKRLKDFGQSLRRVQPDPVSHTAVEVAPAPSNKEDADDVIRIDTKLVTNVVLVLDRAGRNVAGLTAEDFVITEDGEPQKVTHFFLGDNQNVPRSIVLIIDYSGSQLPFIKTSVEAAKTLVDKLKPRDLMAIVTDDVEAIQDFTHDKEQLKKKLDSLVEKATREGSVFGFRKRQFGHSAQYSALMATLNEAFDNEDERPIVVLQTDGDEAIRLRNPIITPALLPDLPERDLPMAQRALRDQLKRLEKERQSYGLEDVYRTAERSRATIYTVVSGYRYIGLTPEEQLAQFEKESDVTDSRLLAQLAPQRRELVKGRMQIQTKGMSPANKLFLIGGLSKMQSALAEVAPLTGGWTDFLEKASQADEIYSRIFSDINQRYIVGYYPTNKEFDGKRRKLKIEVLGHPDYQILGRKVYYAPGPGNK
jgi:VWFA-related protein